MLENTAQFAGERLDETQLPILPKRSPILVICYTNHALDQFLEGIIPFCDSLVRIGGKSQNESLQAFNLSTIKSKMKTDRNVPNYIHQNRSESRHILIYLIITFWS